MGESQIGFPCGTTVSFLKVSKVAIWTDTSRGASLFDRNKSKVEMTELLQFDFTETGGSERRK